MCRISDSKSGSSRQSTSRQDISTSEGRKEEKTKDVSAERAKKEKARTSSSPDTTMDEGREAEPSAGRVEEEPIKVREPSDEEDIEDASME